MRKKIKQKKYENSQKYSRLLSQFEDMQGITSNNFDEKDWNKFDRYVKGQLEEEKKDWIFERSSGYAGYRNTETGNWIYESEYLEKFGEKTYTKEEVIEIIKKYNNDNNTLFFDTDKKDVLNNWIENNL